MCCVAWQLRVTVSRLRCLLVCAQTQGDCSMYGAWGNATASTGKTFQLRALDW